MTDIAAATAKIMPGIVDELKSLVSIPSCAFTGFPSEPVLEMANATVEFLKRSGASQARLLEIPNGFPAVWAEVPATTPTDKTVLVYAHYDVQPTPPDQNWDTDPWTATVKADGRIYGRGAADDKSGIAIHGGVLQAFGGQLPVNVKILIEGEEETGRDNLAEFVLANPEMFQCDAFIIADSGNQKPGEPALTTALRGLVSCKVTVRTIDRALHSGLFGGAVPDALVTLIQLLSTLHDKDGNTAVAGLTTFEWDGADIAEGDLRTDAGMLEGVELVGTGSLASRLWSHPSVTVIGMDVPPIKGTPNALVPEASAKLSLRIAPGADMAAELETLTRHLEANIAWGAELIIEPLEAGSPFLLSDDDPVAKLALDAMTRAWGKPATHIGGGGSIPLVAALQTACPTAGVLMFGAEDTQNARIHSSNESVHPDEIEKAIVAEALFMQQLANS